MTIIFANMAAWPASATKNALESALARPQNKWHHDSGIDIPELGAACAYGLVRNHPYRDGNKRIGFLAMATFLGMNGYELTATDSDVVSEFLALADGPVTEVNWRGGCVNESRKPGSPPSSRRSLSRRSRAEPSNLASMINLVAEDVKPLEVVVDPLAGSKRRLFFEPRVITAA